MRVRVLLSAVSVLCIGGLVAPMTEATAKPTSSERERRLAAAVERSATTEFAAAATVRAGGFTVRVPSSVTSFNKRKVRVAPTVTVSGVRREVTSRRVTVYSGKRRVASGTSVRLRIGRYRQSVTVGYRSFSLVTRHKIVTEQRVVDGGYPDGTACTITAVSSSGSGASASDHIDSASCTNGGYPQQTPTASGFDLQDVPQDNGATTYAVGDVVKTGYVYFDSYTRTVKRSVAYRVKVYGARGRVVTRRVSLVVKDGGYLKIWTGGDASGRRLKFTTTQKSRWLYVLSCGDYGYFGVNWIVGDDYGDFGPQLNTPYGESSDAYRSRYVGRSEFHVFANDCYWGLGVASKGKIK